MKITIVGVGAIGGLLAGRIAGHCADVTLTVLARGETLARMECPGLTVFEADENATNGYAKTFEAPVRASGSAAELGVQDVVIISLKYNAMPSIVMQLKPLIGPQTIIVSAMNGVPWWFSYGLTGAPEGLTLPSVNPDGLFSAILPVEQVIGCVVHLAGSVRGPGIIQRNLGNRLIIGEPNRTISSRLNSITELLTEAQFDIEATENIHAAVWYKLWGNMTMNPISALTGAWSDAILDDPLLRGFLSNVMREATLVGEKIGLPISEEPESRHQVTAKLGKFKTSMLQDVEAGKPIELDALVTAVRDIAEQVKVPTPHLDALLGLTRVYAKAHNLL